MLQPGIPGPAEPGDGPVPELSARLRNLGHCCLLFEQAGSRLLIDPGCFSTGFEELTALDGVLITHVHEDHLDADRMGALIERNPGARVLCDEVSAARLAECGVTGLVVHQGDTLDIGVQIGVYGREHAVIHPDLPNIPNVGYLLANRFFYAGDAFTVPGIPVEIAAVPVGAPWMRMSESVDWLRILRPRVAIPVHDYGNVFAEMAYDLFEQLSPAETTVTVLYRDAVAEL
jgi:L-ascorbate metabolism protein UlaG (beta-lactamase superfamily)